MWRRAFVATGVALGEPLDDIVMGLGDAGDAARLIATLRSESRETRARAVAEQLALIAADVDALEATWPG
jgi:hypothetical protein